MFSPRSSLPTFLIVGTDCLARAGVSSCPFTRLWWAFGGCPTLQGKRRFPKRRAPIITAGALAINGDWCRSGAVLRARAAHCNEGRPHRSLDLKTPIGPPARAGPAKAGRIVARPILGGLHHEYECGLPPKTVPLIMTVAPAPSASFECSPVAACTLRG